jgi:PAS domain S-box-containing protein
MSDAAPFDAILQCNLLELFCEAVDAAILVTDKLDAVTFASVRLLHHFPVPESAITPGIRARDLYGALYDAGCRFGYAGALHGKKREDWVGERVASAWRERTDSIEPCGPDRWFHVVSRRFPSGLGFTVFHDVTEHKKKEQLWRVERERVRMTEEILDSLPISIAVKDRELKFAAVNQQFCKMMNITADGMIGRNVWDIFEPGIAGSMEEADWHLLSTGEPREAIIAVERPDEGTASYLHRAKRVGKAGSHFISLSFDELPPEKIVLRQKANRNFTLELNSNGRIGARDADGNTVDGTKPLLETPQRVVYVRTKDGGDDIVTDAANRGIEVCIIRNEAELSAFLPAVKAAGLSLDLVIIEPDADATFAALVARHGLRCRMLSPGVNVLKSIVDAFAKEAPVARTPAINTLPNAELQRPPGSVEILAIEDNPLNRMVIEQILESLGLSHVVVAEGREALARFPDLRPQIVLADVSMPDMHIADFMLRLEPLLVEKNTRPPVIGLISSDNVEQRSICTQAGLAGVIVKPLSPEIIDITLRKHLLTETAGAERAARSAA